MKQRHRRRQPNAATHQSIAITVIGLGITQIVGYGTLYYAFAVLEPQISHEFGWSSSWSFGCLSLALLLGGLTGPWAGRLIDRRGARLVMALGSVASAIALVLLAASQNLVTFALALIIVEVTSVLVLYDAAFAALSQAAGSKAARRAITQMTLLGGFASTVFWPITLYLNEHVELALDLSDFRRDPSCSLPSPASGGARQGAEGNAQMRRRSGK